MALNPVVFQFVDFFFLFNFITFYSNTTFMFYWFWKEMCILRLCWLDWLFSLKCNFKSIPLTLLHTVPMSACNSKMPTIKKEQFSHPPPHFSVGNHPLRDKHWPITSHLLRIPSLLLVSGSMPFTVLGTCSWNSNKIYQRLLSSLPTSLLVHILLPISLSLLCLRVKTRLQRVFQPVEP